MNFYPYKCDGDYPGGHILRHVTSFSLGQKRALLTLGICFQQFRFRLSAIQPMIIR